jgi:hypothetical protein
MSRGLWFVAGAGAGIYGMVRGRRAAEALSTDGLRDRVNAAVLGARLLGGEVAAGKAEREAELRLEMHDRALRSGQAPRPELAGRTGDPPEQHRDRHTGQGPGQHPGQYPEQED